MIFGAMERVYMDRRKDASNAERRLAFHVRVWEWPGMILACLQHQPRSQSCLPNFLGIFRYFRLQSSSSGAPDCRLLAGLSDTPLPTPSSLLAL